MLTATNPESGTVTYNQYDNNGNLMRLTDARGTVAAMTYDALNRVTARSYTPGGSTVATANIIYNYDQDFRGALSSVCAPDCTLASTSKSTSYFHDGLGRIKSSAQITGGFSYGFSYAYSLTDQLTQITYPSGRTINYALDAADRVTTVTNVATGLNYASLITYMAPGVVASMHMGNGVTQTLSWNDRAQPTRLQVNSGANNLLALQFYPCAGQAVSCTNGNNGNLQSQTITAPSFSVSQTYGYDKLNRLTCANESTNSTAVSPCGSGSPGWAQQYGYDPVGNRWVWNNAEPANVVFRDAHRNQFYFLQLVHELDSAVRLRALAAEPNQHLVLRCCRQYSRGSSDCGAIEPMGAQLHLRCRRPTSSGDDQR